MATADGNSILNGTFHSVGCCPRAELDSITMDDIVLIRVIEIIFSLKDVLSNPHNYGWIYPTKQLLIIDFSINHDEIIGNTKTSTLIYEPIKELITSIPVQQQRFNLTFLHLFGSYCDSALLIQFLSTFGLHLRKLRIDFDCLLNLLQDINNTTQLSNVMFHKYLVYFELDSIKESHIDSEDFPRVMNFLLANENGLRHITILTMWYLQMFESDNDMRLLLKILSSFKHCTQLTSIIICHSIFAYQSYNEREIRSNETDFRKWLNDNTHLTFEQNFDFEYNNINKMIQLWLN